MNKKQSILMILILVLSITGISIFSLTKKTEIKNSTYATNDTTLQKISKKDSFIISCLAATSIITYFIVFLILSKKNNLCKIYNLKNKEDYKKFTEILKSGGVVIMPCDTIYGICSSVNEENRKRICKIKNRPENKKFITLYSLDRAMASLRNNCPKALLKLWPGKVTMIVRNISTDDTTAIRVPDDPFLQNILEEIPELYSTSVNLEGEPELNDLKEIKKQFQKKVDAIGYIKDKEFSSPSTIVDVSIYPFKIIREGEDLEKVRKILESL